MGGLGGSDGGRDGVAGLARFWHGGDQRWCKGEAGAAAALEWGGLATQFWRYYNYFYPLGCLAGRQFCFLHATRKSRAIQPVIVGNGKARALLWLNNH